MEFRYDLLKLREICNMTISQFMDGRYGEVVQKPETTGTWRGSDGRYSFKDNGTKILGVAHVDTVVFSELFTWSGTRRIGSGQFDDRLGVYVLLEVLPQLGIEFDLLLCTDEEDGATTAQYFQSEKQYNWIFEFDRRGDDAVLYQYWGTEWEEALKSAGFTDLHQGSYSDISRLGHLGAKAVNIGVSYDGNCHSTSCTADLVMLRDQIMKFKKFYDLYKDTAFPHDPSKATVYRNDYQYWEDDEWWEQYYGSGAGARLSARANNQSGSATTAATTSKKKQHRAEYYYSWDGDRRWDTSTGEEDMDWLKYYYRTEEEQKALLPPAPLNLWEYVDGKVPGYEEYGDLTDWNYDEIPNTKVNNGELVFINHQKKKRETPEDRWYREQLEAEGICPHCEDPKCYGVAECEECKSWTHDDKFVTYTGLCKACAASHGIESLDEFKNSERFDW